MATNAMLSEDFGPDQRISLAMAGTVRIPLPVPASGAVYLVINPESNSTFPSGSPRYLLKHVQTVSGKQVVTRHVALDELRAITVPPDNHNGARNGSRSTMTVNEDAVAKTIQGAQTDLETAVKKSPGIYEQVLFPDAALHIREAAPVLMRIVYEFGVTAAEAASHVECLAQNSFRCC